MTLALETIAFVAMFIGLAAGALWLLHVAVRPRDFPARSATALRELEPSGGRHRMHVRLVEVMALACVFAAATGAVLALAASQVRVAAPVQLGVLVLLATLFWISRRGALRTGFRASAAGGEDQIDAD
jgi:hypothetical protein